MIFNAGAMDDKIPDCTEADYKCQVAPAKDIS